MVINDYFNIKRFGLLLRRDYMLQKKSIFVAYGAFLCLLFFIYLPTAYSVPSRLFHTIAYPIILMLGGYIVSSMAFYELGNKPKAIFYLNLPGSIFEKLFSKLLITTIVYIFSSLILYYVFTFIAASISQLLFNKSHPVFNPFHPGVMLCMRLYLVTQSIFLFFSASFRKNVFLKTILVLFSLAVFLQIFVILVSLLVFFDLWIHDIKNIFEIPFIHLTDFQVEYNVFGTYLLNIAKIFLWLILAPFFWITTYFRLKESEV